jgi:oxalate---CoA ligase
MQTSATFAELLARADADAIAIAAPQRQPLSYAGLRSHAARMVAVQNRLGIGRNDRVAIVLPNGPEMATAFLACASGATAAPLNPGYRAEEFEFYLSDLRAKALIVEQQSESPAIAVAQKLGVALLEVVRPESAAAGLFDLVPRAKACTAATGAPGPAQADDIALILHTSGTTARPKIVPLTQRNVCASACNVRDTLALTPRDRGLNIMPLFHIHGLIAGLLAPLAAGSSVFCTPGFNALKFFAWMGEARATWYSAVPTMHQAILARAMHNREVIANNPLRFIRSSSSPLPPQVIRQLESIFRAPVIESYGMTEAAHQMASNPLPPGKRIPGSVGVAAGPDIAIMNEQGDLLAPGVAGEVVIRGTNVTTGYENNPKANAECFSNGWFRTGDQGIMDSEGYLTITGRIKEIINRGGEKISPREVDEVLLDHPSVQQAVTFALPHAKLGEDVAAAVVLREGASASERELRDFAGKRLADFKLPNRIVFVEEIPRGPSGKLNRIGLASKLGLA